MTKENDLSPAQIEAGKRFHTPLGADSSLKHHLGNTRRHFIEGANWQKEQDKDLLEAAKNLLYCYNNNDGYVTVSYAEKLKKAINKYLK